MVILLQNLKRFGVKFMIFRLYGGQVTTPKSIAMTKQAQMPREEVLRVELALLRQEHRDLDNAISALHETISADILTLKRLKRNKLTLKDQIARLEDELTPDIIA